MSTDTSSPDWFSMEDLLHLPEFDLDLDNFTADTPSSDSNSLSQRSDEHNTTPSTPSTPAPAVVVCADNGCGCGASFRRPSQLKKHVEQRTRPYACTQEGCTVRPFSSKHDLNRHEREVHGRAGAGARAVRLRCPHVNCKRHHRGFGRKENLALHMRTMHPDGSAMASSPEAAPVQETPVTILPASVAPQDTSNTAVPYMGTQNADMALNVALQDRLTLLQAHRANLARQLQAVDDQIDAVQRTVSGLHGLDLGLDMGYGSDGTLLG